MKFAHLGDCHLGGWRQPELKDLNLKSFQYAITKCLSEKVEFVLITGDLFDSAYPPIETLKEAFSEFRRLKEAGIPVFLIAGSHDYSVSGKTFLEVLEKAGLCINAVKYEERAGKIVLLPILYGNVAIYGYSGKKSGLEMDDIERIKLQDSPGLFKILMLHTAIKDALGNLPIKSVDEKKLPKVNYLALSHLHIIYNKENRVYSSPIFPNNLSELEELKHGSFYLFENGRAVRQEIKLKELFILNMGLKNALSATDDIIQELDNGNIKDKIVLLKLSGILEQGKSTDIDFQKIEEFTKSKGAFVFIKSISRLHLPDAEVKMDLLDSINLENHIIKEFQERNPSKYNDLIIDLSKALQVEKLEDEKSMVFEDRLMSDVKRVLKI